MTPVLKSTSRRLIKSLPTSCKTTMKQRVCRFVLFLIIVAGLFNSCLCMNDADFEEFIQNLREKQRIEFITSGIVTAMSRFNCAENGAKESLRGLIRNIALTEQDLRKNKQTCVIQTVDLSVRDLFLRLIKYAAESGLLTIEEEEDIKYAASSLGLNIRIPNEKAPIWGKLELYCGSLRGFKRPIAVLEKLQSNTAGFTHVKIDERRFILQAALELLYILDKNHMYTSLPDLPEKKMRQPVFHECCFCEETSDI